MEKKIISKVMSELGKKSAAARRLKHKKNFNKVMKKIRANGK